MKQCNYCGAKINKTDIICPYCDHSNSNDIKKQRINRFKEDLHNLENIADKEYDKIYNVEVKHNKNRNKKSSKKIWKFLFGMFAFVIILFITVPMIEEKNDANKAKREYALQKQYYPILNEYINNKDYFGLYTYYKNNLYESYRKNNFNNDFYNVLSDWRHYHLLNCLNIYYGLPKVEIPKDKDEYIELINSYDYESYVYRYLNAYESFSFWTDIDENHLDKYHEMKNDILSTITLFNLTEDEQLKFNQYVEDYKTLPSFNDFIDEIIERQRREANEM